MSAVKQSRWVDPYLFVIRNIETGQVVARAVTEVLARAYFADSLDNPGRYKIEKAEKRHATQASG